MGSYSSWFAWLVLCLPRRRRPGSPGFMCARAGPTEELLWGVGDMLRFHFVYVPISSECASSSAA